MHSSRMRTARLLTYHEGVYIGGEVCIQGGRSAQRGSERGSERGLHLG